MEVPREDLRDPLGVRYWPAYAGRDAMRTPMPWRNAPGGGFTAPGVRPWLPFGDLAACNVEDQRGDPDSMLHLTRDLIALRRRTPDLRSGAYRSVGVDPRHLGVEPGRADPGGGQHVRRPGVGRRGHRVGAARARTGTVTGSAVAGTLRLRGWEAVVVERRRPTGPTGQRPGGASSTLSRSARVSHSRPPRQMAEVVEALPGVGKVAERGGEDPPGALR